MKYIFPFLFVIVLINVDCSSSESTRRGKLSDAMDAASDEHKGERKVEAEFREPDNDDGEPQIIYYSIDSTGEHKERGFNDSLQSNTLAEHNYNGQSKQEYLDSLSLAKDSNDEPYTSSYNYQHTQDNLFSLGGYVGTGLLSSSDLYGITTGGLNLGLPIEEVLSEIYLSYSFAPIQETSKLARSLNEGISLLEAGVQLRFPTTPAFTFVGHYFLFGFGLNAMFWEYKNSFEAPHYDDYGNLTGYDTITSDGLTGLNIFVGTGIDLTQTLPFHIIGEITPGIILWNGSTLEGFDNDIFSPFVYILFRFKFNLGSF